MHARHHDRGRDARREAVAKRGDPWLTTVHPDGQPQSVPLWFLWNGETFLVYSQPGSQKLRNIGRNPRVDLNQPDTVRARYIGGSVAAYFTRGSQSPVRYVTAK